MNRQFPPEIIQLIVEESLDPVVVSYWSFGLDTAPIFGRYSILKRYSVLNSTWSGICKPSLYGTVLLKSETSASSFGYTAAKDGNAMRLVTSMIIGCKGWYNRRPAAVIKHVPRLQSLTLWSASVHAQDFVNMHRLTGLTLSHCTISIPPPSIQLSIRNLRIDSLDCYKAIGALLSPDILPKLEQLDLKHDRYKLGSIDISWLAPQLSALQLEIQYYSHRFLFDDESLRLLSLSHHHFDLSPLTTLPPFMMVFDVVHHSALVRLLAYLLGISTSKPGLKTLFTRCKYVEVVGSDEETETELLVTNLRSKGIVVEIRTGAFSFSDAIRRMDAILLAEKAAAAEDYARVYGESE